MALPGKKDKNNLLWLKAWDDFWQVQDPSTGKGQSLQQIILGKLDIHMQKNVVGPLPYNIYKNWLKMDQRQLNS